MGIPMTELARTVEFQADPQEAANITRSLQDEYRGLQTRWVDLARRVQLALDRRVPQALGMGVREWLHKTFNRDSHYLEKQMDNLRALQGLPEEILGQISDFNAEQLVRLPEADRHKPEILKAAVDLVDKPTEFRRMVSEIRKTKYGVEPDHWETLVRPLPANLVQRWETQEGRIAAGLGVRLPKPSEDLKGWKNGQINVWEWLITAMEQTDQWQMHAWIHDEKPNEREE